MDRTTECKTTKKPSVSAIWTEKVWPILSTFFRKNYALFIAPLLVIALYLFGLWQGGVFPFGKYTAASYDLSAQICPFIEHLFDVMQGKSTLTYTYALVGGVDVVGTFLYFFISPFSFLFLVFGDGKVAYASSFVVLCKLAVIAFSGVWFAKKLFKNIPDYLCIAVGVTYAYCGYTFVSNTYINWMDFLMYMPFCVGAFKRFVKTENFWPFALLMSACIYTCFSIACFSMFTVFPTLIAYGLICVDKDKKKRFIAYLCLAFFVAVLAALPVLMPALAAYTRSGRSGGLFDDFWYGYTISSATGQITGFNPKNFRNNAEIAFYRKWSYILADSAFVALTCVWICRKGLKDPFVKFMLVAGVFTLLPTVVDEAMLLMNMGSYMSYALRFGFLNALYFLGGACLCLEDISFKKGCAYDGSPLFVRVDKSPSAILKNTEKVENDKDRYASKNKKGGVMSQKQHGVWLGLTAFIGTALVLFAIWYVNNYRAFISSFYNDEQSALEVLNGFAPSFAHSLGGMDVILPLFLLVAAIVGLGALLIAKKRVSPRAISILLLFIVGTQIMFYNDALVMGNRSVQHVELADYQALCQELNERDEEYFRVKDYGDEVTACAPLTGGTNSFSVFSSVIDGDNFIPYQLFAYNGNGKNSFKSAHNQAKGNRADEFGDSFLGYKYVFVPHAKLGEVQQKTYLQQVMTTDENGNATPLCNDSFYVYENKCVFPLGYTVKRGDFSFVAPNEANATYRRQNQAALYEFLRGENLKAFRAHDVVTADDAAELSAYLWDRAADVKVGAGKITAKVTAEEGDCLFLSFVASKGYAVYVNGKRACLIDNDLKFLSVALETGENEVTFIYSSPYVRYIGVGAAVAVIGLCIVAFVIKKTKLMENCAPAIAWAGVFLAVAVVAVFMVYPTGAWLSKMVEWAKSVWLK